MNLVFCFLLLSFFSVSVHSSLSIISGFKSNPNRFIQHSLFNKILNKLDPKDIESGNHNFLSKEIELLKDGHQGHSHATGTQYSKHTTLGTETWSFPNMDKLIDPKIAKFFKKTFSGKSNLSKEILKALGLDFHFMDFFPTTIGVVTSKSKLIASDHSCYKKIEFSLEISNPGPDYKKGHATFVANVLEYEPHKKHCHSTLMVMSKQYAHYLDIPSKGKHTLHLCSFLNQQEFDDILHNGLAVFELPLGYSGTVASILWHTKLFTKKTMYQSNLDWVREILPYKMEERSHGEPISIPKSLIPSGSLLAIQSPMFFDSLISWGTGSTIGHTVVALWKNISDSGRELWICESTDSAADPGLPNKNWSSYPGKEFPKPFGQSSCRTYDTWIQQAYEAGFWVTLLPLKHEYSVLFDENKAWDQVEKLKGQDYGYATFLYTFLDTKDNNWPYPATSLFMEYLLGNADRLMNSPIAKLFLKNPKFTLKTMFIDGINQRLTQHLKSSPVHLKNVEMDQGYVNCQEFTCIWRAVDHLDLQLSQVWTMPSKDDWLYPNLQNGNRDWDSNYVCRILKAAGVFGDLDFQCNELTPRDLATLSIWENNPSWKPVQCNQVSEDSKTPYCQLTGWNTMSIPDASTRTPSKDMFFSCGATNWNDGGYKYQPPNC